MSQVTNPSDNPQLLQKMVEDQNNSSELYRPTNYWNNYVQKFIPDLLEKGLSDFRKRKKSIFCTFGGTDLRSDISEVDLRYNRWFFNRYLKIIPGYENLLLFLNKFLKKAIGLNHYLTRQDLDRIHYRLAKAEGHAFNSKPLDQLDISTCGSPEDLFKSEQGKLLTTSMLVYYTRQAWAGQFIDFSKVKTFVELGSGSGKQIEVMKKFYPDMTFVVFDIAPQIYVCEQYLKAVFPEDVVGYEQTRNFEGFDDNSKGKIYVFGSWDFPKLEKMEVDLFWNAASFQEMEPEVVRNYLSYVNKQAKTVFLQEYMDGKETAKSSGQHGVMKKTLLNDYEESLTNFKMDHSRQALSFPKMTRAHETVWNRK